jgi:Co/Zn/Cd efflux system component
MNNRLRKKSIHVFFMFLLTISTATVEIIFGIRAHSQSLVADGMYSFAEGLCLIGVILVLRYSHPDERRQKRNTFGYERLELLFGLIQEVFLLSISLGIIVDAVNHLVNPVHVHDADLMIILGTLGFIVGLLGMILFWGYHHDHNIEEEINQKKRHDFLAWTSKHAKAKRKSPAVSRQNTVPETTPLADFKGNESVPQLEKLPKEIIQPSNHLDAFTYENVDIEDVRIYATLHALCLHSFVGFSLRSLLDHLMHV